MKKIKRADSSYLSVKQIGADVPSAEFGGRDARITLLNLIILLLHHCLSRPKDCKQACHPGACSSCGRIQRWK